MSAMRGGSAAPEESFIAIGAVGYFGACRGWTSRSAAHDAPLCGPPEGSPDVWWKAVIRGSQGTNRMSEPGGNADHDGAQLSPQDGGWDTRGEVVDLQDQH